MSKLESSETEEAFYLGFGDEKHRFLKSYIPTPSDKVFEEIRRKERMFKIIKRQDPIDRVLNEK